MLISTGLTLLFGGFGRLIPIPGICVDVVGLASEVTGLLVTGVVVVAAVRLRSPCVAEGRAAFCAG